MAAYSALRKVAQLDLNSVDVTAGKRDWRSVDSTAPYLVGLWGALKAVMWDLDSAEPWEGLQVELMDAMKVDSWVEC